MRKILKSLSLAITCLLICVFASACTFINTGSPDVGGGGNDVDSLVASQSVKFVTDDENETKLSLPDAYEKVARTSVAITMGEGSSVGGGSGVIVDVENSGNDVYLLTCHHVISGGGVITVYIPDENCDYYNNDYIFKGYIGNEIYSDKAVTLVGGDSVSDIAVIKIDLDFPAVSGNKLSVDKIQKAMVVSDNHEIRVLDTMFAIGNPRGELPGSATAGEVSRLEREVLVAEVGSMTLMQISVQTNPGNSGGGLYNLYGELIGITNAGNTSYDGINFAIPAKLNVENAKDDKGFLTIAAQLISTATATNYGYISDRWNMGITVGSESLGATSYVKIISVQEGSNVALAGVSAGYYIDALTWKGETSTVTPSTFANYAGLMKTELKKGDSFTMHLLQRSGFSTNRIDVVVPIVVADYIFCDTGM